MIFSRARSLQEVRDQAGAWVQKRIGCPIDPQQEEGFQDWLSEDPRNAPEYERLAAIWSNRDAWQALAASQQCETRVPRIPLYAALGGGVVALGALALALLVRPEPPFQASYATSVAERRTLSLPDGSTLEINARSRVLVHFDSKVRRLSVESGEIFVTAAHQEAPMLVSAGPLTTKVVGTEFNIDLDGQVAQLSVVHGVVEARAGEGRTLVRAGEAVFANASGLRLIQEEAALQHDWRSGWIDTDSMTIAELIAELAAYTTQEISIADPTLAERRISGHFALQDPVRTLKLIGEMQNVPVTVSNKRIVVGKAAAE